MFIISLYIIITHCVLSVLTYTSFRHKLTTFNIFYLGSYEFFHNAVPNAYSKVVWDAEMWGVCRKFVIWRPEREQKDIINVVLVLLIIVLGVFHPLCCGFFAEFEQENTN